MEKFTPPAHFNRLFYSLAILMLLGALDVSIIATALPNVVADFGVTQNISWILVGYSLATATALPVYGKLIDKYGSAKLFGWSVGIFLGASLLCGFAPNIEILTFARVIQGFGGAGLSMLPMTIITSSLPERQRPKYMARMGAVWAIATIAGPIVGGFLTEALGWRWVFFINLPIGLVAILLVAKVLPKNQELKPGKLFDISTLILFIIASSALIFALNGFTASIGSNSTPAYAFIAAAVVALVAFFWRTLRAPSPIIPIRSFASRGAITALTISALSGANLFAVSSYVPSLLQMSYGVPGWLAGLALGPMILAMLGVSLITTRRVGKTGQYTKLPVIGSAITGMGMLAAYLFSSQLGPWFLVGCLVVCGMGLGTYVQLNLTLTQAYSKEKFLGAITSTFSVVRDMSGAIVSTITGGIFGFGAVALLNQLTLPNGLTGSNISPEAIALLEPGLRSQVQLAYFDAFHPIFLNSVIAYIVIFVLALTLPKIHLKNS